MELHEARRRGGGGVRRLPRGPNGEGCVVGGCHLGFCGEIGFIEGRAVGERESVVLWFYRHVGLLFRNSTPGI